MFSGQSSQQACHAPPRRPARAARLLSGVIIHGFAPVGKIRHQAIAGARAVGWDRAPVEGINNTIKVIKCRAYGYRDEEYFFLKIRAAFPGIPR